MDQPEKESSIKYPKLMIAKKNAEQDIPELVLFIYDGFGIVLRDGDDYTVGDFSDTFDTDGFEDFEGKITISNEAFIKHESTYNKNKKKYIY